MTFPRIRPPNGWTLGSVLSPNELETIDSELVNAMDGAGGGTYAPSNVIVIGGAGLHVTTQLTADDLRATVTNGHVLDVLDGAAFACEAGVLGGSLVALFGQTTVADFGFGSTNGTVTVGHAVFGAGHLVVSQYGTVNVHSGAAVTDAGAWTRTGAELWGADSAVTFEGSGSSHKAAVNWGPFSTGLIAAGSAWNDAGTWTRSGTETWTAGGVVTFNGAGADLKFQNTASCQFATGTSLQLAVGSSIDIQGTCFLDAPQPASNANPGANNVLFSTNVCKAWASITVNGVGGFNVDDGYNIGSCAFSGQNLEVTFARPMSTGNYAVSGGTVGALTFVLATISRTPSTMLIGLASSLADGSAPSYLDMSSNAITFTLTVMGRQ